MQLPGVGFDRVDGTEDSFPGILNFRLDNNYVLHLHQGVLYFRNGNIIM